MKHADTAETAIVLYLNAVRVENDEPSEADMKALPDLRVLPPLGPLQVQEMLPVELIQWEQGSEEGEQFILDRCAQYSTIILLYHGDATAQQMLYLLDPILCSYYQRKRIIVARLGPRIPGLLDQGSVSPRRQPGNGKVSSPTAALTRSINTSLMRQGEPVCLTFTTRKLL